METQPREVPVRRRTVVDERATAAGTSVFCPRLEQSLPVSACAGCGLGGHVQRDDGGDREIVPCGWRGLDAPLRAVIGEHMSDGVVCVRPTLHLSKLRALLTAEGITSVPVVDDEGRPIGVVSRSDLMYRGHVTVADVMTPLVLTLSERASLFQAAALMAYEGVHHIVVVDDEGRVVGVLSALDVAAWVARDHGYVIPPAPWSTKIHRAVERKGGF